MACSTPFHLVPKRLYTSTGYNFSDILRPYSIPCGWCINCRKDKQNFLADKCNWELCHRLSGSFVTFTYDDNHLFTHYTSPASREFLSFDSVTGRPNISLFYKDLQRFLNRLRMYVKRHKNLHCVLCQPDFSYCAVGEYGDCFGRPHYHVLFFGLDFAYCKKIFQDSWKLGLIDVLPILDGAVNYVTGYMLKQLHGNLAREAFDSKCLARPRITTSARFASSMLDSQWQDIVKHDFTYPVGNGVRRPISQYWKNRLRYTHRIPHRPSISHSLNRFKTESRQYNLKYLPHNVFRARNAFRLKQAQIRAENLTNRYRSHGHAVPEFNDFVKFPFGYPVVQRDKFLQLSELQQRQFADDFISFTKERYGYA